MKKAALVIAILLGVLAIIVGIATMNMNETTVMNTAEFGADFYTYQYKATRAAANNLDLIYDMVSDCFGWLFIFIGGTDITFSILLAYLSDSHQNESDIQTNMNSSELANRLHEINENS